jgi:hypothetical protein
VRTAASSRLRPSDRLQQSTMKTAQLKVCPFVLAIIVIRYQCPAPGATPSVNSRQHNCEGSSLDSSVIVGPCSRGPLVTDQGANFPMPPEERNQMHATNPGTEQNKSTEQSTPACVYSLETLMALQKLLENGIPQPGERLLHSPQRTTPVENNPQSTFRPQSFQTVIESTTRWREYLRHIFMKLRRPKEADRGNSAQQNG